MLRGQNLNADLLDGLSSAAFAILAGQSGGQTLNGGTAASENLVLVSTAHATKGLINLGASGTVVSINEATGNIGIGAAVDANIRVGITHSVTDIAAVTHSMQFATTITPTIANAQTLRALHASLTLAGAVNLTGTIQAFRSAVVIANTAGAVTTASGAQITCNFGAAFAGTVTTVTGLNCTLSTTAGAAGSATTGRQILVSAPTMNGATTFTTMVGADISNQGNAVITTSYGLRIASQSGSGTNWALAGDGGDSYLVGNTMFGSAAAAAVQVEILDATSQLRLTHTAATDYCALDVDTNGRLTISPVVAAGAAASGEIYLNATKLGFFNVVPVVKPAGPAAVATTGATNVTPFGYTTAAQADAIPVAINAIRAALNALGLETIV